MKNKTTETEQLGKRSKKKSGGMQELKTNFNLSITQRGDTALPLLRCWPVFLEAAFI